MANRLVSGLPQLLSVSPVRNVRLRARGRTIAEGIWRPISVHLLQYSWKVGSSDFSKISQSDATIVVSCRTSCWTELLIHSEDEDMVLSFSWSDQMEYDNLLPKEVDDLAMAWWDVWHRLLMSIAPCHYVLVLKMIGNPSNKAANPRMVDHSPADRAAAGIRNEWTPSILLAWDSTQRWESRTVP